MKKLILSFTIAFITNLSYGQLLQGVDNITDSNIITTGGNITARNPNNINAAIHLRWLNDVATLRVGGSGPKNGIDFQKHGNVSMMRLLNNGNVGIGTVNPSEKLTVNGKILCEEVEVVLDVSAPDYVFQKYYTGASTLKADYTMPTLEEIEAYTKANHHLPEMPSAATIKEDGLQLKEMSVLLLQKIEELTLYTIEQEKRIKALEATLADKE